MIPGPGGPRIIYTFDPRGSVTQRLNSTGGVIDTHLFDAYGTEQSPKAIGDPFAFGAQWGYTTDQATASDTGLVLCGWRYYDPTTGRFLTRDPIGYAGGMNLYAFAGNNPVNYADPSGTNPLICGAVGAGLGALFSGGMAYVHHQNVWRAVVRGATVGGVTGFFTCLGAPELGAGFLGGAASGTAGGALGDAAGQTTAIVFGWQDCFNWPELCGLQRLRGRDRRPDQPAGRRGRGRAREVRTPRPPPRSRRTIGPVDRQNATEGGHT